MVITGVSVIVAVLIGGIEGLGLIGDQFGLTGWFWDGAGTLNDNFNGLGFAIIGVFVVTWIASVLVYRYAALDRLEVLPEGTDRTAVDDRLPPRCYGAAARATKVFVAQPDDGGPKCRQSDEIDAPSASCETLHAVLNVGRPPVAELTTLGLVASSSK